MSRAAAVGAVSIAIVAVTATASAETVGAAERRVTPWLGVSINESMRLWGGVPVVDVFEGMPAALCGLRPGDEIIGVDGLPVAQTDMLQQLIGAHDVGDKVSVEYIRSGELARCNATLTPRIDDPTELLHRRLVDRVVWGFGGEGRGGGAIDEAALRGRVTVLALFATSCDRCASLLSDVEALARDPAVDALAVTLGEPAAIDAYVQVQGVTVPLARDLGQLVSRYLGDRDNVTFLVVDHEGVVRFAASGEGPDGTHLDNAALCVRRAVRALRDD